MVNLTALDDDGYVVIPGVLSSEQIEQILTLVAARLAALQGDVTVKHGGTLHLDDLTDGGPAIDASWSEPRVVEAVSHLLGPDSGLARVHYRAPRPGHGAQHLHADGVAPSERGVPIAGATVILALVDFRPTNGATRVVPGTHRPGPAREIQRWAGPAAIKKRGLLPTQPHPGEAIVTCPAGAALVFAGSLWHSGTRNDSDSTRHSLQISWAQRRWRAVPTASVSAATRARLGDRAAFLLDQ